MVRHVPSAGSFERETGIVEQWSSRGKEAMEVKSQLKSLAHSTEVLGNMAFGTSAVQSCCVLFRSDVLKILKDAMLESLSLITST